MKRLLLCLIVSGMADVDGIRQKVLDDALVPQRPEHWRDAKVVQAGGNLAGGNDSVTYQVKIKIDVLDPLVDDRRPVLQGFVERLGRPVASCRRTALAVHRDRP